MICPWSWWLALGIVTDSYQLPTKWEPPCSILDWQYVLLLCLSSEWHLPAGLALKQENKQTPPHIFTELIQEHSHHSIALCLHCICYNNYSAHMLILPSYKELQALLIMKGNKHLDCTNSRWGWKSGPGLYRCRQALIWPNVLLFIFIFFKSLK